MKKIAYFFISLSSAASLSAQSIDVREGNQKFSTGSQNALSTVLYETTKDDVESAWKSKLKDFKNESVKSSKKEMFGDNVVITQWGNNTVDIYTTFEEDKKARTVKMNVAFDLGGAYLSSSDQKDKCQYAEKLIKEFAFKLTQESFKEVVKKNEKLLSDLEDDQKKLEKKEHSLLDDIEDYKSKIAKEEKVVIEKNIELEKKNSEIATQKKVVKLSSNAVSEQEKSAEKIYDKLVDQKEELEKDIKNAKSTIESNREKIAKAESQIKENKADQSKKKSDIDTQKNVLSDSKKALDKLH